MFKFIYSKFKTALTKTRSLLSDKLEALFKGKIDEETLDELERLFYEADLGAVIAAELVEQVKEAWRKNRNIDHKGLVEVIRDELLKELRPYSSQIGANAQGPTIILIVGVNGSGKTTTVAKLAKKYLDEKKKVIVAAADTFRAAAIDQLELWASRLSIDIVKGQPGSDPAAVAFDALQAARARGADVVIIDTAGRLQVKTELMHELAKIRRVCQKAVEGAPHETLLVLDATIGQNAIDQAETFHKFTPLTGLILTKLDGTAKGGAALSIQRTSKIPIKLVGLGEGIEDLQSFDATSYVDALLPLP